MLYLLDADTLITGERLSYRLHRFPTFWEWLRHQGRLGNVKVPLEQFEEVVAGRGDLVDWLKEDETKEALLFDEEAEPALVGRATLEGYGNLDENGIAQVGRDPFLVAYGLAAVGRGQWSHLKYRRRQKRGKPQAAGCLP